MLEPAADRFVDEIAPADEATEFLLVHEARRDAHEAIIGIVVIRAALVHVLPSR